MCVVVCVDKEITADIDVGHYDAVEYPVKYSLTFVGAIINRSRDESILRGDERFMPSLHCILIWYGR